MTDNQEDIIIVLFCIAMGFLLIYYIYKAFYVNHILYNKEYVKKLEEEIKELEREIKNLTDKNEEIGNANILLNVRLDRISRISSFTDE